MCVLQHFLDCWGFSFEFLNLWHRSTRFVAAPIAKFYSSASDVSGKCTFFLLFCCGNVSGWLWYRFCGISKVVEVKLCEFSIAFVIENFR